jgi:poly(3-hydroxybutyrate) depolymerase
MYTFRWMRVSRALIVATVLLWVLIGDVGSGAAATSLCQVTPLQALCPSVSLDLNAGGVQRTVTYQVPLGTPPVSGWPVVFYFQGSFFPGDGAFSGLITDPFGMYYLTLSIKALLDAGYAVLAPNSLLDGYTFWQTNIPPWDLDYTASNDNAFMLAIFQAIADGTFGPLNASQLYAMGISSGGFMTSRMAVSYPGKFRALAIHSASYATCSDICIVPPLPANHPPTLFLHGLLDPIVPIVTMEVYRDALLKDGFQVETVINDLAGHQWIPEASAAILNWFNSHL